MSDYERVAEKIEALRQDRPLDKGGNGMLDKILKALDQLAGDDAPSRAAATVRRRLDFEAEEQYMATYGNPEWQAEQRRRDGLGSEAVG